jgi:hypothetical protein
MQVALLHSNLTSCGVGKLPLLHLLSRNAVLCGPWVKAFGLFWKKNCKRFLGKTGLPIAIVPRNHGHETLTRGQGAGGEASKKIMAATQLWKTFDQKAQKTGVHGSINWIAKKRETYEQKIMKTLHGEPKVGVGVSIQL